MSRHGLKKSQRCCSNTADGSRCGKFAAPGETVCSKHRPDAPALGIIAQQHSDDPLVELRRLMKSRDPMARLRAAKELLDHQEQITRRQGCPRCLARADSAVENDAIVNHASPSQREA